MKIARLLLMMLPLVALGACSGGGSSPVPLTVAWPKFRHDVDNSGAGNSSVADNNGVIKWQTQIDQTPISASPAIDANGTLYIATEGGTLAALEQTHGTINWSVCSCDAPGSITPVMCPPDTAHTLGPLISSPAVYAFSSLTNIFIGSATGTVYMFRDNGVTRSCTARFEPAAADFGGRNITSRFISSPTFTTNPGTSAVSGVFIGAAIDITTNGTTHPVGKLYALNSDGTLIWQFPRVGEGEIGAVTSSPALGAVDTIFFTSEDGYVYALTSDGTFKWKFPIGMATDPRVPFSPSPLNNGLIFAPSASGQIFSLNPDGSFRWSVSSPDGSGFLSSLAVGLPATTTPTITPMVAPTPTPPPGATATPTATATPVRLSTAIFGVTTAGSLVQIDVVTGMMNMLLSPAAPIAGPVVSSPLLSVDGYLVVGAADGKLHAIDTITGLQPSGWPVTLAAGVAIRSSPSMNNFDIVYVGADNGTLYAVGTQ